MKFRDFLLKRLLEDTDYLVGYTADGEYIRISRADLAASIAANTAAPTLAVQYSANRSSWHDSYAAGDHYMQIKAGSGTWSAAIPLCVSAYDIWKQKGNSGDEDDFLRSLKGEPGEPGSISGLTIQQMEGYEEFLQQVNNAIATAKNALVTEVTAVVATAMENALDGKLDKDLSNLEAVTYMGENASILILTSDNRLCRVSTADLASYTGIVNATANSSQESSLRPQRKILALTGNQDGHNIYFSCTDGYIIGTSALYLNGNRLYAGVDYREENSHQITFLTYIPASGDIILFEAIPLNIERQ